MSCGVKRGVFPPKIPSIETPSAASCSSNLYFGFKMLCSTSLDHKNGIIIRIDVTVTPVARPRKMCHCLALTSSSHKTEDITTSILPSIEWRGLWYYSSIVKWWRKWAHQELTPILHPEVIIPCLLEVRTMFTSGLGQDWRPENWIREVTYIFVWNLSIEMTTSPQNVRFGLMRCPTWLNNGAYKAALVSKWPLI